MVQISSESILLPAEEVPINKRVEVLVVGGGPAGLSAAVAAARNGANTLLVERNGFLGGVGTAGLCTSFMGADPLIIRGFAREIIDRLASYGCFVEGFNSFFDGEIMKYVCNEIATEAGVKLLFDSVIFRALVDNGSAKGITVLNKSGHQAILADVVIDATGDGDVAARAGATFQKGNERGQMQSMTLMFRMGNVDVRRLIDFALAHKELFDLGEHVETGGKTFGGRYDNDVSILDTSTNPPLVCIGSFGPLIKEAKEKGELYLPHNLGFWVEGLWIEDEVLINTTMVVGADGTNADDISRAWVDSRKQVMSLVKFLQTRIPGFEKSHLIDTAQNIGVRETRRIVGEYMLTKEDVIEGRRFPDVIARNSYPIDVTPVSNEKSQIWIKPKKPFYEIPYRCLLPKGIENLLVAGRCMSVTHEALGSTRSMICSMGAGQAAGTAAALAAHEGITPKKVRIEELQKLLTEQKLLWPA
jgi:hypothetical protein